MSEQPTPESILQVGLGFWPSKILLSAVEMELFTDLAHGPRSLEGIRGRSGLHPRAARDFLDALVALGFLLRTGGGEYSNAPATDLFLDKNKPSYIGGILEMANHRLYQFWNRLTEALRTGLPQNEVRSGGVPLFEALYADPARLKSFLLAFLAGRAAGVVTTTFAREAARSGGFCAFCGTRLPEKASFCVKCGANQTGRSASAVVARIAEPPRSPLNADRAAPSAGAAGAAGRYAGDSVRYLGLRPKTVAAIVCLLILIGCGWYGLFLDREPQRSAVVAAAPATFSSVDVLSHPSEPLVILNLPALAFAPFDKVSRYLGKPLRITADHNLETWSEGAVTAVKYRRAECLFLRGRLIDITYKFAGTTHFTTVAGELMAFGFPERAANLSGGVLPFHAMYPSNPLRCCGLALHLVSIPEDFSSIWVVFANMNLHFTEWSDPTREAWRRAGGPKLSTQ